MELGRCVSFNHVKEVDVKPLLHQFAGNKGTHKATSETVNPHGGGSLRRISKIAVGLLSPSNGGRDLITYGSKFVT